MEKISVDLLRERGLSRRLSRAGSINIQPGDFIQSLDLNLLIDKDAKQKNKYIQGFYELGASRIKEEMLEVADLGIKGVSLRIIDEPVTSLEGWKQRESMWMEKIGEICEFGKNKNLQVIIDPFSIGLQETGQWGILESFSERDTLKLIENISKVVSTSKSNGIITLGRVPKEVQVTREFSAESVKIYSFSNNSETPTAYAGSMSKTNTLQKIIPGNFDDMIAWSMMDIYLGSDVLVTKPLESFQISSVARSVLESPIEIEKFLSKFIPLKINYLSNFEIETLMGIKNNIGYFYEQAKSIQYGAYAVSGSTQMLAIYADKEGVDVARRRLEETWMHSMLANGENSFIIDRGCKEYFLGSILH